MKRLMVFGAMLALVVCGCATMARAQSEKNFTRAVRFAKGKSSAVIKGVAQAYTYYAYTVRARADQNMNVSLKSSNGNVFLTLFEPGGLEPVSGEDDMKDFDQILNKTGIYKIMVFSKSDAGASNYTLKITITAGEKY